MRTDLNVVGNCFQRQAGLTSLLQMTSLLSEWQFVSSKLVAFPLQVEKGTLSHTRCVQQLDERKPVARPTFEDCG